MVAYEHEDNISHMRKAMRHVMEKHRAAVQQQSLAEALVRNVGMFFQHDDSHWTGPQLRSTVSSPPMRPL